MKLTQPTFGLAWLLMWFLVLTSAGVRAADLLPPQQVIQHTSDQMQQTLQKPEYKKNFIKATQFVEGVLEEHVDFDRVSMLILGKYWKTATPEQQARFKKEFRLLLVRTYTTAFTEYANWTIRYLPLKAEEGANRVVVRTEILQPGTQPVRVDYRMVNAKGDWKVYDVMIEGVSLVQNYRTSFTNDIASSGSLDKLLSQLAQRNSAAMKEPIKSSSAPKATS